MGLLKLASLRVVILARVRLPTFRSPQTRVSGIPLGGVVVVVVRPGKRVVRFGFGSDLCSVRVNFGLSPFGSGTGSDRVKFGFGFISGQLCSGRVWVRFG